MKVTQGVDTIFPATWYDIQIKKCTQAKEVDNHANCFSGQNIS